MTVLSPPALALVRVMRDMPRGPRRDGAFALWLLLRVVEDLAREPPPPERASRRRVAALGQRLTSLALPAPLRRALAGALAELAEPSRERGALALHQLVAPARETLGSDASDALARAARRYISASTAEE